MSTRRGMLGRLSAQPALAVRILGAFMVVLAVAATVTLFLENRLTRAQVADQAASVVAGQVGVIESFLRERNSALAQALRTEREVQETQNPMAFTDTLSLNPLMFELKRQLGLDTITAFDADGATIARLGISAVAEPPPAVMGAYNSRLIRTVVVPTTLGRHAVVLVTAFGPASQPTILAAGYQFDDAAALDLRSQTGVADVILVVEGEVAGSTFGPVSQGETPPGVEQAREGPGVVTIDGQEVYVDYIDFVAGDGMWGLDGTIGVALAEPLAALDATLSRNRALMALLLIVLAFMLSIWVAQLLTRPLRELAATASKIAGGDLDASFEHASQDEVGRLAGALEQMRQAVRNQLGVIRSQASALQAAARRIVGAQDEERRRVAHDLHDGVQQQLVMLRLHLNAAQARVEADPTSFGEVAEHLRAEVDGILERIRETSQDLYPAILRDRGLAAALRSMAGRIPVGLIVRVSPDPLPRFPLEVEANAYFLAAEAVTNALKHAEANDVVVTVDWVDGLLTLAIEDDGVGFDPSLSPDGSGLRNLRDRVLAVDGELSVTSSVGEGTRVVARFRASVDRPLEVEQDRGDAAVEVVGVAESEVPEDGVGVLLDGALADDQGVSDRGVPLP